MDGLAETLQQAAAWVWQATWRASVLIGIVMAIRALLGRWLSPKWTYALWLLVVVRLVLPWGPASPLSLFNLFPHRTAGSAPIPSWAVHAVPPVAEGQTPQEDAVAVVRGQGPTTGLSDFRPKQDRMILISVLPWVWLAGALALAAHIAVSHYRLWRIVRFERAVIQSTALGVLDRCRARMRIGTLLGVVLTDQVQTPALFGLVRPRLLIPAAMSKRVTALELRHVFLHELAHLKHHDVAVGWLVAICQVLHWFNPLVWLAFHQMRADRELACDERAMSYMAGPKDTHRYGQTLIRLQEVLGPSRPVASLACIVEARSQLKARIERIADSSKSQPWHSVLSGILLLLVGIIGLTDATIHVAERPVVPSPEVFVSNAVPETHKDVSSGEGDPMEAVFMEKASSNPGLASEDPRPVEDRLEANGMSNPGLPSSLWSQVFLYYDFDEVVVFTEALPPEQIGQIVSILRPAGVGSSREASAQQGFRHQENTGGIVEGGNQDVRFRRHGADLATARFRVEQVGFYVEMITDQLAMALRSGNGSQLDPMAIPLRLWLRQLQSSFDVDQTQSWSGETNLHGSMPIQSLSQAVEILCQSRGDPAKAQSVMANMASLVDQVVKAVENHDRPSLQAGCSQLRLAYHQLVTAVGLDKDPPFQTVTRPTRPTVTRPPTGRVRGRTVLRGR